MSQDGMTCDGSSVSEEVRAVPRLVTRQKGVKMADERERVRVGG